MPVATFVQPNFTAQTAAAYKAALDAAVAVLATIGADYACHAKATPDMQVQVDAGQLFLANSTLVSNAQQTSITIVAPVGNPRIDRIVINDQTGVMSVITGTPAASPAAPAITAGTRPIAQILLQTSSTVITNSMITDERVVVTFDVSTYIRTLLLAADAPAARTTLGAVGLTGDETVAGIKAFTGASTHSGAETHSGSETFTPVQFFTAGIGPNYLQNIGIAPSVASKALTVAFKTKALADASATDLIQIAFRNVTLATGDYVIRSATAAASVVAPSGATLGFVASQTGFVYVYAIDNAGAIELILSGSNHWDEATVQSTTAISATADSRSVLYSTTARTNVPIRYIGRIKIQTGAVAGEWDNAPTEVHVGELKRSGRIATASGTAASFLGTATYSPTVNVEVGDIVLLNYKATCITGAAAFVDEILTGKVSGTSDLETYPNERTPSILFGSFPAHGASASIDNNYSIKLIVVTAGTLISVGATAASETGTAPTSKNSYVYSEVWRI